MPPLAMTRGRFYAFQLALAVGSAAATSWGIVSGGLPTGITLNTSTGRISGTPDRESEGSTGRVGIRAINNDGDSETILLTWGIEYAPVDLDGGITAVIDLDTGVVGFIGLDQRTEAENRAIVHVKRGDQFPLPVIFMRRQMVVDMPITGLRITGKKEEADAPIPFQAPNDLIFYKQGEGETARYLIWLSLRDERLAKDLEDDSEPRGTAVSYISEIWFSWAVSMGESSLRTAERSSLEFEVVVHRDSLV